ncbi:MAG: lamin tail domain-containing protein, partial [Chlamydiia bacterium]|nr:lamin tail domain-containing protein [Chlamydiia bacterium]
TGEVKSIVINEINYKSGDVVDAGDWIELYNPNSTALDISNWQYKDAKDDNIFIIPDGTSIDANSYLVITKSTADFKSAFPNVKNFIGDFDFGLSSSGDAVRIFNADLELQDEVHYGTVDPWPICANGQGPTLELKSPDLDNSLGESWGCLSTYGSPGVVNDASMAKDDFLNGRLSFYPNPTEDYLYIKGLKKDALVRIIDTNGKILVEKTTKDKVYLGHIDTGVYILNIILGENIFSYKIVKK